MELPALHRPWAIQPRVSAVPDFSHDSSRSIVGSQAALREVTALLECLDTLDIIGHAESRATLLFGI